MVENEQEADKGLSQPGMELAAGGLSGMVSELVAFYYPDDTPLRRLLLQHSLQVRDKALAILANPVGSSLGLDREQVAVAALLHDIGIGPCHAPGILCSGEAPYMVHGVIGARMLRAYGARHGIALETYARVCERHTGSGLTAADVRRQRLPMPEQDYLPETWLEKLICLADKFYSKSGEGREKSLEQISGALEPFGVVAALRFKLMCILFGIGTEGFPGHQAFVPLGYCLVLMEGGRSLPPCVPAEYLAVAGCPCAGVIPGVDTLCVSAATFDSADFGRKWGLSSDQARALFQHVQTTSGRINGALLTYRSCADAAHIRDVFFHGRHDVLLIGLGGLDAAMLDQPDLQQVSSLPMHGELLGYDVYGLGAAAENGELPQMPVYARMSSLDLGCPICCCDADGKIPRALGVTLNAWGLYADAAGAVRAADLVNRDHLGEPVWHVPVALIRY